MKKITADVLVVGGGAGGVTAAIQASRCGVKTILATEFPWLGGMLTSAGVAAPDGNELAPWHTGLWGAYLKELQRRQGKGLDNGWVSLFTYHPGCGAKIFADWVAQIPNLNWIKNCKPKSVIKHGTSIIGVKFESFLVEAKITIDATELGDLLALAEIPYLWGWESFEQFNEPSLPEKKQGNNQQPEADFNLSDLIEEYPVQAPTWVFVLQDYGGEENSAIIPSVNYPVTKSQFIGAWDNYGGKQFLDYGKLTNNLYMINWPIAGNDYGVNLDRLIASEEAAQQWLTEAYEHSYDFAHYIQSELGQNYGLASNIFPQQVNNLLPSIDTAFALHPYYRESRRLQGKTTVTEHDILPIANGCVASLPINEAGEVDTIAI
ncbi:FAD-dependent oxidoreductase, partial [Hyella patelloides]|uniref:FAD-dependent oxidoreductase n=1 Tax=Hyella patelloides TaxID=1982969 RepID=UPI00119CE489